MSSPAVLASASVAMGAGFFFRRGCVPEALDGDAVPVRRVSKLQDIDKRRSAALFSLQAIAARKGVSIWSDGRKMS
jgi:hypothetical protein